MKLDVQVLGRTVAKLYRERDEYVLKYTDAATPADFVSLAMPVGEQAWRWPRDLHPFFRQNLPEGYLLNIIREELGPLLDGTDLSLLAVVGGSGIGRVTVTPEDTTPGAPLEPLQIEALLTADNSADHFAALVRKYARTAISGVVPKFIAPEAADTNPRPHLGKPTLRTSRHIIKGSDDNTPYLGFNEFYSMRVLERVGTTPVARTRMSDDGRLLIVDRFDVDSEGIPVCGVEDLCSLLGLPPHEKYTTTTERIVHAARAYLPPAHSRTQLEQLGWLLLVNYVVRNADCHAKNIALYYRTTEDVAFTPAYDIVTTQAYPRYAQNPPGLSIGGRKTWGPGKTLAQFFNTRLGISPKRYAQMVEQLCDAAVAVAHEMAEAARNEPKWHHVAGQMLHAWNDGMDSLRSARPRTPPHTLDALMATTGFAKPEPPESGRTTIGRSELLAKPRKKKPRSSL